MGERRAYCPGIRDLLRSPGGQKQTGVGPRAHRGDTFAPQAGDEPPSAVDLYESKVGELPKFNKDSPPKATCTLRPLRPLGRWRFHAARFQSLNS